MTFKWRKIGRSHVARFGRLSVSVVERGSRKTGYRWRVSDVFGNGHLGGDWHSKLDRALDEAERIAEREARALMAHVAKKRERSFVTGGTS
jgi:hypothetical protein